MLVTGSQQQTFRIELPLSVNHPWTISITESSSLAVSWPPQVSILHELMLCKSTSFSLELMSLFAVSVDSLM